MHVFKKKKRHYRAKKMLRNCSLLCHQKQIKIKLFWKKSFFFTKHPEHIEKVKQYYESDKHTCTKEKAFALYVTLVLSKSKYIAFCKSAEEEVHILHTIYFSYFQLQQANIMII